MSEEAAEAFQQGAGFAIGDFNIWVAVLALSLIGLWIVWILYGLLKQYTSKEINLYQFTTWGFGSLALVVFLFFILV